MADSVPSSSITNIQIDTSVKFSIISYNLHGFNQGANLLRKFCLSSDNPDLIFIQEHWMTSANLYKLNHFHKDYSFYGISAMDSVVSNSILRGRPWGGVSVHIKSKHVDKIRFIQCKERFVV